MTAAIVTATFAENLFTLTVILVGNGSGVVSSEPVGISCPDDCTQDYLGGTEVTLTPLANEESAFTGWSGDCTGESADSVLLDTNRSCTARFILTTQLIYSDGFE